MSSRAARSGDAGQLDVFLRNNPASAGVLAALVGSAGQLAAQFELSATECRLVALGFAVLLACYQILVTQRRPIGESAVLVPIVALVLFTSGWGASGLIRETEARLTTAHAVIRTTEAPAASRLLALITPAAVAATESEAQPNDKEDKEGEKKSGGLRKW